MFRAKRPQIVVPAATRAPLEVPEIDRQPEVAADRFFVRMVEQGGEVRRGNLVRALSTQSHVEYHPDSSGCQPRITHNDHQLLLSKHRPSMDIPIRPDPA